jgi:hypothetical protein
LVILLIAMEYGFVIWYIKRESPFAFQNRGMLLQLGRFERTFIILACGAILRRFIEPVLYGIQQIPMASLMHYKSGAIGYFSGWIIAMGMIILALYLLSKLIPIWSKSKPALEAKN